MELELAMTTDSSTPVHSTEGTRLNEQVTAKKFRSSSSVGRWKVGTSQASKCLFCLFRRSPTTEVPKQETASLCGSEKHHVLFCRSEKGKADQKI